MEVCVHGVWGSVCDDGWDKTDGLVVCSQMGYPRAGYKSALEKYYSFHLHSYISCTLSEPIIFLKSYFGESQYPLVYSNMDCEGWEESLGECKKNVYLSLACSGGNTAGLLCRDSKLHLQ